MSYIFEALQKSECAEKEPERPSTATELLRRAEVNEASKRAAEVQSGKANEAERMDPDAPPPQSTSELWKAAEREGDSTASPPRVDDGADLYHRFQSLKVAPAPESRLVGLSDANSPAAEAFRLLGVRLHHLRRDRLLKAVLVTSTVPQEGKTTVAANLARALAKTGQRILLLEGDLRRPSMTKMFGLGENPGVCECLQGERSLPASLYFLDGAGFWLLPAGKPSLQTLELLQSGKLLEVMNQLRDWFDWIVIDSPPILPLADTSVWSRITDGILLVTRQGVTEKRQLKRGLEAIEPQRLLGALVNCSSFSDDHYYYDHLTAASMQAAGAAQ